MGAHPVHQALLEGVAHLSPTSRARYLRLEARGLFTARALPLGGVRLRGPGLYRVHLWPRTDREGFVVGVQVVKARFLEEAPVGAVPGEPLRFRLVGRWLGAWEGLGRILVVPQDPLEVRPFPVRFLLRRPGEAPPPGGLALARGVLRSGRLVGEVVPMEGGSP
ncbi:MAG: hypothetical protein NZ846_11550 [Thermus sp.]|uniref:hypothetical protein n=1 Tax=Thermus sp. TaxID=275 RepID=UPI0025FDD0D8|nr:hypothetical protein [Thermus sp.]MCS7219580.1 hypothetical protein [Thermus sp.]